MYQYRLKKYDGQKSRLVCPNCGQKNEFVPYENIQTGSILSENVGRCNREVKCGYHYKPKEYFADNPGNVLERKKYLKSNYVEKTEKSERVDFIPFENVKDTLINYQQNNFVTFLLTKFSSKSVESTIQKYFIGTWKNSRTVFWQIDAQNRIRTGKIILFDEQNGKRSKIIKPYFVHSELKKKNLLPDDFKLEQYLFGEHLICGAASVVGIVESEKTAIIANLLMPDFIWLATGGSNNLKFERVWKLLRDKKTLLFPDSSKFSGWSETAAKAKKKFNLKIEVSTLLEKTLSEEIKKEDVDIADFLLDSLEEYV